MKLLLAAVLFAASLLGQRVQFNLISQEIIMKRLASYTTKNATREPAVKALFEEAGCKQISEQPVKGLKAPNLICVLPGESEDEIVVGAHFDLVEKGHGVVDNWTGASLLSSLFQSLSNEKRKHTFVFVAFAGEEGGLAGSRSYVKQRGKDGTLGRVKAMVNLDTLGLGETEVWHSHADPKLLEVIDQAAAAVKLPLSGMNVDNLGTSDSESFREKKIPSMTIHSLTGPTVKVLHSQLDTIEAVNPEAYYHTYRLTLVFLALLDVKN